MSTKKIQKGINPAAYLVRNLFDSAALKQIPTRTGFGEGLVEAGKKDKNVVVLCCDLTESTRSELKRKNRWRSCRIIRRTGWSHTPNVGRHCDHKCDSKYAC